jgi:Tol biopolymer transport system component
VARILLALLALAVLVVAVSMTVGCGARENGGNTQSVPPGTAMVVYRSTISGEVSAKSADKSARRVLDLPVDPSAEVLVDFACATGGSVAAYAVANGRTGNSRLVLVGAGNASLDLEQRVAGIAWSPDGTRIVVTTFDPTGSDGYSLLSVDVASGATTELARGEGLIGTARWSPDGTMLAFDLGNRGPSQVYLLRIGDPAPARMTNLEQGAFQPEWKPGGHGLLFSAPAEGNLSQIFSLALSGEIEGQLTDSPVSKSVPRLSPDGTKLAFVGVVSVPVVSAMASRAHNLGVWVAAADGSGEEMFTDLSEDAWLLGWCTAGPWLEEVGED